MTQRSRFWEGTVTGDATDAPYDGSTKFAQAMLGISNTGGLANKSTVCLGVLNQLVPTISGANILVDTGEALVYGSWYQNDASVSVAIPTPVSATRIDRIVLRKDWTLETIRVTRIAGVEGGSAPALVQNVGVTWDFPIGQTSTTTGGVITLTDQRVFGPNGASNGTSGLPLVGNGAGVLSTYQQLAGAGIAAASITAAKLSGLPYLVARAVEATSLVTRTTTGTTDLDTGINCGSLIAGDIVKISLQAFDLSALWSSGGAVSAQVNICRDGAVIGDGPRIAGMVVGSTSFGNGGSCWDDTFAAAGAGTHSYKGQLTVSIPATGTIAIQAGQIVVETWRQS
jgi:hypothetical protein